MERVLLMGYFGAGNFGDDALLAGWLAAHERFMRSRGMLADVISSGPDPLGGFVESQSLRPLLRGVIGKREALSMPLATYSALLAPGGSLLQDTTSLKSLLYYLTLIRRFTGAGKPVFLLNQGLGPFNSMLAKTLTPRELARVRLLSLRDQPSFDWARRQSALSGHQDVRLSADPLLAPVFERLTGLDDDPVFGGGHMLIIPKPPRKLRTTAEGYRHAAGLRRVIDAAGVASGLRPILLPLHEEQDRGICDVVAELHGSAQVFKPAPELRFGASAILTLIARAGLVISYRLHGLVCAAACGVPAFGVAYDPKVSAFCNEIGYPYCSPHQVLDPTAANAVTQLWLTHESVVERLQTRRAGMLERLRQAEERFHAMW